MKFNIHIYHKMNKKKRFDEACKIREELVDKYVLKGYEIRGGERSVTDMLYHEERGIPVVRLPTTVNDIRNEPAQYSKTPDKPYDIYDTINTELDAIEARNADYAKVIQEPNEEEIKSINEEINIKRDLLDKAINNVEKISNFRKNIPIIDPINPNFKRDEINMTYRIIDEVDQAYNKALLSMYSLTVEIDRLNDKLYPQKALNKRLELYKAYDEEKSSLSLSEYIRLNTIFNGEVIIRLNTMPKCSILSYACLNDTSCYHFNCLGQSIRCDCYDEPTIWFSNCDCPIFGYRRAFDCPHTSHRRILSDRSIRLRHLGILQIDDSAYLAQYERAKKGPYDNADFLQEWAKGHPHRQKIKLLAYDSMNYYPENN